MSIVEPISSRARLLAQVEEAARVIAPLWPLSTSIAVNPLWDLRQMPFDQSIVRAGRVLGISGLPSRSLFAEAYLSQRITEADLWAALGDRSVVTAEANGCSKLEKDDGTPRLFTVAERHDLVFGTTVARTTDREVAKWCAAYLASAMPSRPGGGFYAAWRAIIARDPAVRSIAGRAAQDHLAGLPVQPEDAVLSSLERLGVAEEERVSELERQLARMPGWAGHAKWRSRWAPLNQPGPALHLIDYLAVRLGYDAELLNAATAGPRRPRNRAGHTPLSRRRRSSHNRPNDKQPPSALSEIAGLPEELREKLSRLSEPEASIKWLEAYENHYRDWLLAALDHPTDGQADRPAAQAVFCIDVRSEGLRRHLEAVGPYETLGFAGFFALPIRYQPWGSVDAVDLCPVLLRPNAEMLEQPSSGEDLAATRQLEGRQALAAANGAFQAARKGAISSFILAEAGGFLAGPVAALKTLAPLRYLKLRNWARQILAPPAFMAVDVDPALGGMSDEEQALFAETALSTMGFTRNFAPVVLLCGHGSTTENNPYASSLDCGACGGNRGGPSARAAAAILNRATTRQLLAERGIFIPDDTILVVGLAGVEEGLNGQSDLQVSPRALDDANPGDDVVDGLVPGRKYLRVHRGEVVLGVDPVADDHWRREDSLQGDALRVDG